MIDNFLQYAMVNYDNPQAVTIDNFNEDLQKFIHIKKLLNREEANVRLTLNHIITMYNVFRRYPCTVMLFLKTDKESWPKLKTYLEYLKLMPEKIPELSIIGSDITLDQNIIDELRKFDSDV